MPDLTIELAGPEDKGEIMALWATDEPTARREEMSARWDWMFGDGGYGRLCTGRIDGRMVGQLAVLLSPLTVAARRCELAWIFGLAVSPEHRRKGIATRMLQWAMERFGPIGAAGANPASQALFRKAGWIDCGECIRFARISNHFPWLLERLRKLVTSSDRGPRQRYSIPAHSLAQIGASCDVDLVSLYRFDAEADDLTSNVSKQSCVLGRTSAQLNWRYVDRPGSMYHLVGAYRADRLSGWMVLSAITDGRSTKGSIVDIFWDTGDPVTAAALMRGATCLLRKTGASTTSCAAFARPLTDALTAAGFSRREVVFHLCVSPDVAALASEDHQISDGFWGSHVRYDGVE